MSSTADIVIVGGGLAGGLTALTFALKFNETGEGPSKSNEAGARKKIVLLESSDHLGGHHTWSFHENDVSPETLEKLKPMVTHSWPEHSVQFPRFTRTLKSGYYTIRSEDFERHLKKVLGKSIRLNAAVAKVTDSQVTLESGEVINAKLVLDARGIDTLPPPKVNGYQKFIGLDLRLKEPHGLTAPILMDATCPQLDGFRFFYLLPWDEKRLMIEETYYSDSPDLNVERITRSIRSYAERRGWKVAEIEREERGVLPIPMTSDYIKTSASGEPLPIGSRGGYFHATTGYSVADAIRFAEFLTIAPETMKPKIEELTTDTARNALTRYRRSWLSRQRFYRLLNRLLFYASEPGLRYMVMQRFYELPDDLIERFYAGRSTWADRIRTLSGKPPVPIERALRNLTERSVLERNGSEK